MKSNTLPMLLLFVLTQVTPLIVTCYITGGYNTGINARLLRSYTVLNHSLVINGDDDLLDKAAQYGWPGDGSPTAPITIQCMNITTINEPCLVLNQTTLHVVIHECILTAYVTTGSVTVCPLIVASCSNVAVTPCNRIEVLEGDYAIQVRSSTGVHIGINETVGGVSIIGGYSINVTDYYAGYLGDGYHYRFQGAGRITRGDLMISGINTDRVVVYRIAITDGVLNIEAKYQQTDLQGGSVRGTIDIVYSEVNMLAIVFSECYNIWLAGCQLGDLWINYTHDVCVHAMPCVPTLTMFNASLSRYPDKAMIELHGCESVEIELLRCIVSCLYKPRFIEVLNSSYCGIEFDTCYESCDEIRGIDVTGAEAAILFNNTRNCGLESDLSYLCFSDCGVGIWIDNSTGSFVEITDSTLNFANCSKGAYIRSRGACVHIDRSDFWCFNSELLVSVEERIKRCTINGSRFEGNASAEGIHLQATVQGIDILNSRIAGFERGIVVYQRCSDINITDNEVCNCSESGIWISDYCSDIEVRSNVIDGCGIGVLVQSNCSDVRILGNNITCFEEAGIFLLGDAGDNLPNYRVLVAHNILFSDCGVGLKIVYSGYDSVIYDNYIWAPTPCYVSYLLGTIVWNMTKMQGTNVVLGPYLGGNFWCDYVGRDADGDWIGDTPYEIHDTETGAVYCDYLPLLRHLWAEVIAPPNGTAVQTSEVDVRWDVGGNLFEYAQLYLNDSLVLDNIDAGIGQITLTDLDEGWYTLRLHTLDQHGGWLDDMIYLCVDRTPPELLRISPLNHTEFGADVCYWERFYGNLCFAEYLYANITLSWSFSDALSGISHYVVIYNGTQFYVGTTRTYTVRLLIYRLVGRVTRWGLTRYSSAWQHHNITLLAYDQAGNCRRVLIYVHVKLPTSVLIEETTPIEPALTVLSSLAMLCVFFAYLARCNLSRIRA